MDLYVCTAREAVYALILVLLFGGVALESAWASSKGGSARVTSDHSKRRTIPTRRSLARPSASEDIQVTEPGSSDSGNRSVIKKKRDSSGQAVATAKTRKSSGKRKRKAARRKPSLSKSKSPTPFRSSVLPRVAPSAPDAWVCFVSGCEHDGLQTAFETAENLWVHIKDIHIIKYYFSECGSPIAKGEVIMVQQKHLYCDVGHEPIYFHTLSELGNHVTDPVYHEAGVVDSWPYNPFWKQQLQKLMDKNNMRWLEVEKKYGCCECTYSSAYSSDQALYFDIFEHANRHRDSHHQRKALIEGDTSRLKGGSLGKRVQTRNLKGYVCPDHQDVNMGSPEGLWNHWMEEGMHLMGGFWCPISGCSERSGFADGRSWYDHICTHRSVQYPVAEQGGDQPAPLGWLPEEMICPFVQQTGAQQDLPVLLNGEEMVVDSEEVVVVEQEMETQQSVVEGDVRIEVVVPNNPVISEPLIPISFTVDNTLDVETEPE
ncbi:hypothetical protein ACWJJH_17850 [Endozoicomonadaceae bacterium StTr2]